MTCTAIAATAAATSAVTNLLAVTRSSCTSNMRGSNPEQLHSNMRGSHSEQLHLKHEGLLAMVDQLPLGGKCGWLRLLVVAV